MVEGGSADVLEETGIAGCGAKGPETTGALSGGTGRCKAAKGEGGTGWEWGTTENGLGRETPVGSGVETGTGGQREGGSTTEGGLATWETGIEEPATASDNHTDIMEKMSGGVTSSWATVFK